MIRIFTRALSALTLLLAFVSPLRAQTVYVIDLKGPVDPSSAHHVARGIEEAEKVNASWIVLHMDTYGGDIFSADSIRQDVLNTSIPVAVFIDRNAASAGAIISLACDSIYMAPASSIGAATVVNGETMEAAPDKYQSYFRSVMRSMATDHQRSPAIAEKMIDQDLQIDSLDANGESVPFGGDDALSKKPMSPAGQVITFTTDEAIKYGFCEGKANNLKEVLKQLGMENAKVIQHKSTPANAIIEFLVNPAVTGILMLIIFWGIILEVKIPGFGFPGIAALAAIALYFAPHYIHGVAEKWEILVFGIGLVLIALEFFVIPGFGVAGVAGVLLTFGGLIGAMVPNNGLDFSQVKEYDVLVASAIVVVGLMVSIILALLAVKYLFNSKRAYPLVDKDTLEAKQGYVAVNRGLMDLVGKEGVASTDLKPSGFIMINEQRVDAEAEGGFIPRDSKVVVVQLRGNILCVRLV